MNFSFKPHQLVGHWVPGFIVVTIWLLADVHYANLHSNDSHHYVALWSKINVSVGPGFAAALAAIVPFVIGQFLDALRNGCEELFDRKPESQIKWNMIKKLTKDELGVFEDYYFGYYVFSANLGIGLIIGLLLTLFLRIFPCDHFSLFIVPVVIGIIVFFLDAYSLRKEIKEFLDSGEENHNKNENKKD